jgi:hypothetical protein
MPSDYDENGGGGGGVMLSFLSPLAPKAIVSTPPIRRVAVSIMANKPAPKRMGFTITKRDTITLNAPTPMRRPLEVPGMSLEMACVILAIPLNNKANPAITIKSADVTIGNSIRKTEIAITTSPSKILAKRVFLVGDKGDTPIAILSIPTIKNTMERIMIVANMADPGTSAKNIRTATDKITAIEPKTICNIRSQGGDLTTSNLWITFVFRYIYDRKDPPPNILHRPTGMETAQIANLQKDLKLSERSDFFLAPTKNRNS